MAEMWKLHTFRLYYGWNVICLVVQYSFCCMLTHIIWLGKELRARCGPMGFFFCDNRQYYIFKEKWTPQSTLQASKRTTGRLCLLKQKDWTLLMESFATTWAAALQSLLTQENRQDLKDSNRRRILLIIALISQWGWMEGESSKTCINTFERLDPQITT